jgi:membrane protein implicated in regulation of membrane protease activity
MDNVFLGCFLFGAIFTLVTTLLGSLAPDVELGAMGKVGKVGKLGKLHVDVPHADAGAGPLVHADGGGLGTFLSGYFTLSSLVAFLTWFGAAGYILSKAMGWSLWMILPLAVAAGVAGGGIIAWVIAKIKEGDRPMNPADYKLEGTLARVSVSLPENGVGEIVFSLAGTTRCEAARAEGGHRIPDGTEVVITRYERGIATVQPFQALMGQAQDELKRLGASQQPSPQSE